MAHTDGAILFTFATAVNDRSVLTSNLAVSPIVRQGRAGLLIEENAASAAVAYNRLLDRSATDIVVLAHQDVYLPSGWGDQLTAVVERLEAARDPWAVLGVWGVTAERSFTGRVWCSGGNQEHASGDQRLTEVASIDEIVIVLKRSSGLRFDEGLPGFHLYGTDIVQQARSRGLRAYGFHGPVVHNSRPNPQVFDRDFFAAYRYLQRKWADHLPLSTCTVPVTKSGWPLCAAWMRAELGRWRGYSTGGYRRQDPAWLAASLGYE